MDGSGEKDFFLIEPNLVEDKPAAILEATSTSEAWLLLGEVLLLFALIYI